MEEAFHPAMIGFANGQVTFLEANQIALIMKAKLGRATQDEHHVHDLERGRW